MKVKFHRTVQNTTYYTYRKLNTSRDTLSSREPCWRQSNLLTAITSRAVTLTSASSKDHFKNFKGKILYFEEISPEKI